MSKPIDKYITNELLFEPFLNLRQNLLDKKIVFFQTNVLHHVKLTSINEKKIVLKCYVSFTIIMYTPINPSSSSVFVESPTSFLNLTNSQ